MPDRIRDNLTDSASAAAAAGITISPLPDWSSLPQFGQHTQTEKTDDKEAYGVYIAGEGVGLVVLKYHFDESAELWWLGVHPRYQKRGIAHALFLRAKERALAKNCRFLTARASNDRGVDMNYDSRRNFYFNHGFVPLLKVNDDATARPMMWMVLPLA